MVAIKPVGTWIVRGVCFAGVVAFGVCAMAQDQAGGSAEASSSRVDATAVALDPHLVFERVIVGADGVARAAAGDEGGVAGAGEHLIYGNTLGIHAINFPSNQPVSDDIATTAPNGCMLTRYRFKVLGKVLPTGAEGPYTVTYGLYTQCPLATGSNNATRDLVRIPGTEGVIAFPDDGPRMIEHVVIPAQSPVQIPTNVYLGIRFNRANCGTVVGAPAMIGYSGDIWDFPGFPCNGYLGGFPELPHASFWLEMFASDVCPQSFVAYKAERPSGGGTIVPNGTQGVDDAHLIVDDCHMLAYEVAVRGVGTYAFDLRRSCEGPPIAGTERDFVVNSSSVPLLQIARFNFDPPIVLGTDRLYVGFKVHSTGSVVLAGTKPVIGESIDEIYRVEGGACHPVVPEPYVGNGIHEAVNLAITCAGELPTGACCDPYLTECAGGEDADKRCLANSDCTAPGTCESVCRETTELNCPFPPRGLDLRPTWQAGKSCEPDPFGNTPCGVAACCHKTPDPSNPNILIDVCENLTKNDCESAPPLDESRLWQLGQYCGLGAQRCPRNPCLAREGSCYISHSTPGCSDPFCCSDVCAFGQDGAFCCNVAWDDACVTLAEYLCMQRFNNQCAPDFPVRGVEGALTVPVPGSGVATLFTPTTDPGVPGFCCNAGTGTCIGGTNEGAECVDGIDCNSGQCSERVPDPGGQGLGPFWFKFAPPAGVTSVGVSTCNSNSPALDSIVNVFAATDHSSQLAACNSLVPIGCNDDYPNCGSTGRNSRLCLNDLNPGETYYIELAAKTANRLGEYRVTISTSCTGTTESCPHCPDGEVVFIDPPNGVVDARRPHAPLYPQSPQGISTVVATGPEGATAECWSVCESPANSSSVEIVEVSESPPGTYTIQLNRPITAGAVTMISYLDDDSQLSKGRFISHPGNVDGNAYTLPSDILSVVDHINGYRPAPWGKYSTDLDYSGAVLPADILTLIDLLNGTNGFAAWNGTPLPSAEGCP